MDLDKVFLDSKWDILYEIARKPSAPTEIAKKLKISIANVTIQIRLLEALGFLQKEKESRGGRGKPRLMYTLDKEFAYITLMTRNIHGKKLIKLDAYHKILFNTFFINDMELHPFINRIFFEMEDLILGSDGFGYIGKKESEIEMLLIHPRPDEALQGFSGRQVTCSKMTRKIMLSCFTREDFTKMAAEDNEQVHSLLGRVYVLFEKDNMLSQMKSSRRQLP